MGKQLGIAISWNPWFSYIFGSSWFSPSSVLPISLYWVITSLIVISSKSDKFFERHLPWSAFRSVHLRSVKSHHSFTVTSPSNHPSSGLHLTIRKPLKLRDFWDVSMSFSWVYYKTKGYKKSLMPWRFVIAQGFWFYYVFQAVRRSFEFGNSRLNEFVSRHMLTSNILAEPPYGTLYGVTSWSKLGFVKASGYEKSLVTTGFL